MLDRKKSKNLIKDSPERIVYKKEDRWKRKNK